MHNNNYKLVSIVYIHDGTWTEKEWYNMSRRKNIGLLINDINGSYQTSIWLNFKNRAEQLDCNLIAFEGKRVGNEALLFSEKQHNFIYKLIDKSFIDALILISSPLTNYIGYEKFIEFCSQYKDIPMISIGTEIPGAMNIMVDGKIGIKEVVNHLIEFHNYKRIGFLKGTNYNNEAVERYQAYLEVLKDNNLPIDHEIIFDGEFSLDSGYNTVENILLNNIQLDALVCANDNMAVGALSCMKDLNMGMDKRFYITGFDDSPSLKYFNYPLTTVRQPLDDVASQAFRIIISNEFEPDKTIYLPTKLVRRHTCGCTEDDYEDYIPGTELSENIHVEYKFHELLQVYTNEELFSSISKILNQFNIKSCYIAKYSGGPVIYNEESEKMAECSELIFAFHNYKRMEIPGDIKDFRTKQILPDKFLVDNERFTYLINPLFFGNEQFGYIVFNINNNDITTYESLRGAIINALKTASLCMENIEKEKKLSELEKLATLGKISIDLCSVLNKPANNIESALQSLQDIAKKSCGNITEKGIQEKFHDLINSGRKISKMVELIKDKTLNILVDDEKEFTIDSILDELANLDYNPMCEFKIDNLFSKKLRTDRSKLRFVILNIARNSLIAYKECYGPVEISAAEMDNSLVISITDYAGGIPDNISSRLFKKCFVKSESSKGAGLGLYVSNLLVKNYFKGVISFETGSEGTTFEIRIPLDGIAAEST